MDSRSGVLMDLARPRARRGPLALGLTLALGLVLGLLPAAAQAAPTWLAPVTLSELGGQESDAALDPQGNALVVWSRSDGSNTRIEASFRAAGGSFVAAQEISDPGQDASSPQVAFDPFGNALAVWRRSDGTHTRIQAAFRPAGGSFGPAQTISASGQDIWPSAPAQLAFDAQGNAVAVWSRSDGTNFRVQAAIRPAGGSFGPAQTISDSGEDAVEAQVAVDPQGNAVAVWSRGVEGTGTNARAQAAFRPAGGSFGTGVNISGAGRDAFHVDVAVDPQGNALAVWKTVDAGGTTARTHAAFRPAGGSFGAAQDISGTYPNCDCPETLGVAVDHQGNALAVWGPLDGGSFHVDAGFRPAGGSFGAPQTISGSGAGSGGGLSPEVAFDPRGNALAVWALDGVIQAARRPRGGSFGAAQNVSTTSQNFSDGLAFDGQGNAITSWFGADFSTSVVQAAGYDAAGPRLNGLSIPAGGRTSAPLSFSVSPLDVWSPVALTNWSFGDGGTASGNSVSHSYTSGGSFVASVGSIDAVGNFSSARSTVAVVDDTDPVLGRLRLSPRTFEAAARGRGFIARVGTRVRYRLSEAARVRFRVERAKRGRRVRGRCRRETARNRSHRRCRRYVRLRGGFTHRGKKGANRLRFRGRLRGHRLRPGRYRLVGRATDAAGNRSAARRARFRIVRR